MTKKRFMAAAAKAGIEVEYRHGYIHPRTGEERGWEITLDAPAGKLFTTSQCHVDCSLQGDGRTPIWADVLQGLYEIIDAGFEDCEDAECDVCHPEEA